MKTNVEIYTVYTHFLSALINNDLSGLNDSDMELFDEISEYIGNRVVSPVQFESYFGKPDHGRFTGDIIDVKLIRFYT